MKHLKFDNNCHLVNARGDRLKSLAVTVSGSWKPAKT